MYYFQTKDKTLFSYDNETGLTFVFKNGKWDYSDIVFGVLVQEEIEEISKREVKKLTNGVSIDAILNEVKSVLDFTI